VALPIPFDGFGTLEVDLLCADARVVVELDGGQHLADPAAYRRDRRKDQFLQENGYFVLRFLAEDVGKELDAVLDAILRVLAQRHRDKCFWIVTNATSARFQRVHWLISTCPPTLMRLLWSKCTVASALEDGDRGAT